MPLVDYASSSEDERPSEKGLNVAQTSATLPPGGSHGPLKRRRVLPSVPSNYTVDPGDDPSQHQGRTRSRAFVPGELNAHIYVNLKMSRSLRHEIDQLVQETQAILPGYTLYSLLSTPTPSQTPGELHVSLTHPLPLRRSQLDSFRAEVSTAVRVWAKRQDRELRCSLAGRLRVYYNGKATGGEGAGGRAFLALRLGAGSAEITSIVDDTIHPLLAKYHLPLYHENPEFHASFAWCLLEKPKAESLSTGDLGLEAVEQPAKRTPFNQSFVDGLSERFEKRLLAAQPKDGWVVPHLTLRVGKSVTDIPLA